MIDIQFLAELEGFTLVGVVPTRGGQVLGHSGVTIGLGIDLGQQSLATLRASGVSRDLRRRLKGYLGLQGEEALRYKEKYPLYLTQEDAQELSSCIVEYSKRRLANYIGDWEGLTDRQQTVVFSVFHQYGLGGAPKFMRYARDRDWESLHAELLDFGDIYWTRRRKEAKYLYGDQDCYRRV